jgi:hypothetical protein
VGERYTVRVRVGLRRVHWVRIRARVRVRVHCPEL